MASAAWTIEVRVFDDAAAFRFVVPGSGSRVPDAASTFRFFETYNIVAFLYLVITISLSMLVRLLERRLKGA